MCVCELQLRLFSNIKSRKEVMNMSMNDNPIIGVYAPNDNLCTVHLDPVSGEVYYFDDMECPYLLTGFDLSSSVATATSFDELEQMHAELPDGIVGIIRDGAFNWLLSNDNKAYKVAAGTMSVADAIETVDFEDDMEYEPEGGDSDDE